MLKYQIVTFFIKPGIKRQEEAWKIFHYFKTLVLQQEIPLQNRDILLLDIKIPLTRYFGRLSYMNKVTMRLKALTKEGTDKLTDISINGVPPFDGYKFKLDKRFPAPKKMP